MNWILFYEFISFCKIPLGMIQKIEDAISFLETIGAWESVKTKKFTGQDRDSILLDIANLHKRHGSKETFFFYGMKGFLGFSNEEGISRSYASICPDLFPNDNIINLNNTGSTTPSIARSLYYIPIGKPRGGINVRMNYLRVNDPIAEFDEVLISSHAFQNGMNRYDIWCTGYRATGEYSPATLIGKSHGFSFEDAVRNFTYPKDVVRRYDGHVIHEKGSKLKLDHYKDRLSIWGCTLYDNEADARKPFG